MTETNDSQKFASVSETLIGLKIDPVRYLLGLMPKLDIDKQADIMLEFLKHTHPRRAQDKELTPVLPNPAMTRPIEELLHVIKTDGNDNKPTG